MNCATVKAWLRERFDQGLPLEDGFETHFETCDKCRAYLERLRALESHFADMSVESPSPRFEDMLIARMRGEIQASAKAWGAGVAVVVSIALVVVGWRVPVVAYVDAWLAHAAAWQPDFGSFLGAFMPFVEWGREAWASIEFPGFLRSVQSPWISGASIAVLAVILVAFNAAVRRLGGHSDPSSDFHAR